MKQKLYISKQCEKIFHWATTFASLFLMNDCCVRVTMHTHVHSEQQKLAKKLKILNCPLSHALQFSYKSYVLIWQLDCIRLKLIENIHQLFLLDLLMQSTEKKSDVLRLNGLGNTGELHPHSETLLQSRVHSMLCLSRFTAVDLHLRIYLSLTLVH